MHGRPRRHSIGSSEKERQQVGLVIVRVDDVDLTLANEPAKGCPDAMVERVALEDFNVVDREPGGETVKCEHLISTIADVTDRDSKASSVRSCRAVENGLFRSTADATDASKLENANWARHSRPSHCLRRLEPYFEGHRWSYNRGCRFRGNGRRAVQRHAQADEMPQHFVPLPRHERAAGDECGTACLKGQGVEAQLARDLTFLDPDDCTLGADERQKNDDDEH